jgi:hypothetical protein
MNDIELITYDDQPVVTASVLENQTIPAIILLFFSRSLISL